MTVVREPARAGSFYPRSPKECAADAARHCRRQPDGEPIVGEVKGGVVPHAGWVCSGQVAGNVFAAVQSDSPPQTVVLLGAVHRVCGREGAVFASGQWRTPLGTVDVDEELAKRLLAQTRHVVEDSHSHEQEHSLEVQVPFVQHVFPDSRILPVLVPPVPEATAIGQAVAQVVDGCGYRVVVVGSTDLTHYGPAYGFTPQGRGKSALDWAKDVNDRRIIDLVLAMKADEVVAEATSHHNACGAGALAAVTAATDALGATRGVLLEHTTSREVLGDSGFEGSVGYAGIVFV